ALEFRLLHEELGRADGLAPVSPPRARVELGRNRGEAPAAGRADEEAREEAPPRGRGSPDTSAPGQLGTHGLARRGLHDRQLGNLPADPLGLRALEATLSTGLVVLDPLRADPHDLALVDGVEQHLADRRRRPRGPALMVGARAGRRYTPRIQRVCKLL